MAGFGYIRSSSTRSVPGEPAHPPTPRRGESPHVRTTNGTPKVSEREARQVAEAAREQDWRKPSFAKELFLGRLRLDLIHPHPTGTEEDRQRGEAFLAKLRDFCETKIDSRRDRARVADPRRGDRRAQGARRPRHEDRHQVRRPRPDPGVLQQGARAGRLREPGDRRAALRAPVDRCTAAAEAVRHPGAEGHLPAALRPYRHLRLPAHRAGRGLRPGPAGHRGRPRRRRLRAGRRQAVDHQRRGRRPAGGDGPGAHVRGAQGRHHGVRRRGGQPRHHRGEPQRVHGPARHRERRHPLPPGPGARPPTASAPRAPG